MNRFRFANLAQKFSSHRSSQSRRKKKDSALRTSFERLEARELMTINAPVNGELVIEGTGLNDRITVEEVNSSIRVWHYTMDNNFQNLRFQGFASFPASSVNSIEIDAHGGNDLVINATNRNAHIDGGSGNDQLIGGSGNDTLLGRGGNDSINGGEGNDSLIGGDNNDTLRGYGGDDTIKGSNHDDKLYGGNGDDLIQGNSGNDYISGGSNNDELYGNDGNDTVYGNGGDDLMFGGRHNDKMKGYSGNDTMHGESGADTLYGYGGDDDLYGGYGNDLLYGQDDNDGMFGGGGYDKLYGGTGANRFLVTENEHAGFMGFRTQDEVHDFDWGGGDDAKITFRNGEEYTKVLGSNFGETTLTAGTWKNWEIEAVDQAFSMLMKMTGNTELLKKPGGPWDGELVFVRQGNAGGAAGLNNPNGQEISIMNSAFNNDGDSTRLNSKIDLDWLHQVVLHEVGHNFDEAHENSRIQQFRNASGWRTMTDGTIPAGMGQADDNNWSTWMYDLNAAFVRDYGQMNPLEDFATSFAASVMLNVPTGRYFFGDSSGNIEVLAEGTTRNYLGDSDGDGFDDSNSTTQALLDFRLNGQSKQAALDSFFATMR